MDSTISESAGERFGSGEETMMSGDTAFSKSADQAGQDPTVQRFRPIFSAIPFSKLSPLGRDVGACDASEADMDDERPQSARTVDGYSRVRDLMDIDAAFTGAEHCSIKPRPLYGVHEDCFAHVLRFLPLKHLSLTGRVSRDLRRACNCDSLWIKLCHSEYGSENATVLMERYSQTVEPGTTNFWKHTFKAMMHFPIQLQFTGGPRAGETQVVVIGTEGSMIGRSRQNNICILQDEMVSRKHAKISKSGYNYLIHDVGSINGTFVNQKQLTKFVDQRLHFGDQVDMGNSVFTIELGPVEEAPLASEV